MKLFRSIGRFWCRIIHDAESYWLIFHRKLGYVAVCPKCRRIHA